MQITKVIGLAVASFLLTHQAGYAMPVPAAYTPPADLKAMEHGDGWVFVDAKGMTLYFFGGDEAKPGKSTCNEACAQQWPPLLAAADAKPNGAWTIVVRDDDTRQWAVDGRPLYHYAEEGSPGTTFGDGDGNIWHTAYAPIWSPPGITIGKTIAGSVLADAKGMTLYTRNGDSQNKSSCMGSCLENFALVTAPSLAHGNGDWSVIARDDSSKQWAYKGKPLYRSLLDVKPGETNGDGAGLDEGWRAAVLQPAVSPPSWVTVRPSLAGELLADGQGMTLYYHGEPRRTLLATTNAQRANINRLAQARVVPPCVTATCMGNDWKAVLADANMKPVGNWTIIANQDGTQQWAYKGKRVYVSTLDKRPGEFKGVRFGGDRQWQAITRNGIPIQNM